MNISFDSKGNFDKVQSWLDDVIKRAPNATLNQIADEGTRVLVANTPRDTGETASGWKSKVTTKGSVSEVAWYNDAHPEASANVAKLIDLGHGTGTGGYVAPRPYIKKAMDSVFKTAGDKVAKELIR